MSDYFSGAVKDGDSSNLILSKIWYWMFKNWQASSGQTSSGISIPASDYVAYTYYTTTNNIHTATYKTGGSSGTTVATLTFTYVGSGASNDDNVASITKT